MVQPSTKLFFNIVTSLRLLKSPNPANMFHYLIVTAIAPIKFRSASSQIFNSLRVIHKILPQLFKPKQNYISI